MDISTMGFVSGGLHHVSGSEALRIVSDNGILLDVRPEYERGRVLPVDPALFIPYDEIDDRYRELPEDVWIIIVDAAGLRSGEVARFLVGKGYQNILHLAGGVVEWERDGLPILLDKDRRLTGSCMCQLRNRG